MNVRGAPARVVPLLGDVLFRHWGTKISALLLAVILFVFSRDEVTRAFEVPLRVRPDPERALLTELPDTIQVQVRGPWTRINRLQDYDFGSAEIDLRKAEPGPLEIDRGTIVMPSGVVLSSVQYDHVDLRFEPVVERKVPVVPVVVGEPAADHRLVRIETRPANWTIAGGQSVVQSVRQLSTAPVDVQGATLDIEAQAVIMRPSADVRLARNDDGAPTVEVRVVVEPVEDAREVSVPVPVPEGLDPTGVIPETYEVQVSGPVTSLDALDALGIAFPIEAEVVAVQSRTATGGKVVEIRFGWTSAVPAEIREALGFDHGVVRVALPAEDTGDDDGGK